MADKKLIGYARVSTSQQGRSGLGLEAQKHALKRFADAEGFTLLRIFVEVESGKGADALERRPQLAMRSVKHGASGAQWQSPNWTA